MGNEIITKRLKEALQYRNMTAAELCRRTGIDRAAVSRYLSGKYVPKQNAIGAISEALNINPAWLLGYDVPMSAKLTKMNVVMEDTEEVLSTAYSIQILDEDSNHNMLIDKFNGLSEDNKNAVEKYIDFLLKNQED